MKYFILIFHLLLLILSLASCSRNPVESITTNVSERINNNYMAINRNERSPIFLNDDNLQGMLSSNILSFETELLHQNNIRAILSEDTTNDITFAAISNRVIGISSKEILDCIIPAGISREFDNPQTYAMAMLYEVVLSRPNPPWARLFALSTLASLYNSAGNYQVIPLECSSRINKLMREATLSDNPNDAERNTYANIKHTLMRKAPPEEQLKRIEELRKLQNENIIHLDSQPYDVMVLFEARSLLELDRIDEARRILNDAYDKSQKGEIHPFICNSMSKGPQEYLNYQREMVLLIRATRLKNHKN